VRFEVENEITLPEFLEMAWLRHRSSVRWIIGICLGAFGLLLGAFFYVYSDPWPGLFLAAMSVLLLLRQLVAPSIAFRRVYRRKSPHGRETKGDHQRNRHGSTP
jgi:drug/metabolite transporter (DMT)-like permease